METPTSSEGIDNKENINLNNIEGPKLGMEPLQMKKRKNGGGYNLRKSLAWDKAFFTDEGILDPLELTLITGINNNTHGGRLATISEDEISSCSSDTRCKNESEEVQASEESSHKELPDKSRQLKGNTGKKATQKALSIHRTSRNESKVGGCREPVVASSLKRPANLNTMKSSKKESKLPKLPNSKPGTCFSRTTEGSMTTTTSQLRHKLIPKPTIKDQKNVGLKSYVKDVQGSERRAKMGSCNIPSPAKGPTKKATNSSSKATSSTKLRSVQVESSNSVSKMIPDRSQLSELQVGSAPLAAKNLAQHTGTNSNNSLPQAATSTRSGLSHIQIASSSLIVSDRLLPCESQDLCTNGAYTPNTQPAKPSGLRPPSRSLRFFDQRTTLETGLWQQKRVQQYDDNINSNRKIGELRPPMKSNDKCSYYGSTLLSPSPIYSANATNSVSDSNINPNLERRIVDIKAQDECRGLEVEVISGAASVGGNTFCKIESVQQRANTYVQSENQTFESEESCSLSRKVAGSMLEEKPIIEGAYNDQVCVKDCLSPKMIANLEEPNSFSFEFRIGANGSKINLGEEVEKVVQERNSPIRELDDGSGLIKNNDAPMLIKRSNSIKKQDNSLILHPPNAVPFSDEWLAAIEAAGEEILTMKCGAVQHSPQDKSHPEPSPWSPVKKKANQIGPYDCTKHTNAMPPNP